MRDFNLNELILIKPLKIWLINLIIIPHRLEQNFIELASDANKHDLLEAMSDHILAQTELIGVYSR